MPWRRAWEPTSVFLPGKSHGQRSLAGHSPWSLKELDTTEAAEHPHTFIVSDVSLSFPNRLLFSTFYGTHS